MAIPQGFELVEDTGIPVGFEIVQPAIQEEQVSTETPIPDQGMLEQAKNAALEVMAGVNRNLLSIADIPADIANAVSQLSGSEFKVPTLRDQPIVQQGISGGFVQDPNLRQALGLLGEFVAPAPPIAGLSKRGDDFAQAGQALARQLDTPLKAGKQAEEAVRQGFSKGFISDINNASRLDKRKFQAMIDVFKRGQKSQRARALSRPSDIAGKSLIKRINKIKMENGVAGAEINKAAMKLQGRSVDVFDPIQSFSDKLNDLGVGLSPDGKGFFKADFTETGLAPGDRGPIKEVIRQMSRLSRKGNIDAQRVHELKRIIDRNVTYGKSGNRGLSGDAERALKQFRAGLDSALDASFPAYRKANEKYSETISALDDIQQALGTKLDLSRPSSAKAVGTRLRSIESNIQSRAALIDSVSGIDELSKKLGAKFGDDVVAQTLFANTLDEAFGATARTSLKGQVGQGTSDAVAEAVQNLRPSGFIRQALRAGGNLADKVMGVREITEENALKSLEELLRQ